MKLLYFMSLTLNVCMVLLIHPIFLAIMTITQSMLLCYMMTMILSSSWTSYIMFLIFLGGIMILFMYMCSVSPNESSFKKINSNKMKIILGMMLTMTMVMFMEKKYSYSSMYLNSIMNMFNKMFMIMTLMIMMYLLLSMIVIVKNVNIQEGPLRMKKNM